MLGRAFLVRQSLGQARSSNDALPWFLSNDWTYMVHCWTNAADQNLVKTLRTVADIACFATREAGVTELSLTDHSLTPMMEDIKLLLVA